MKLGVAKIVVMLMVFATILLGSFFLLYSAQENSCSCDVIYGKKSRSEFNILMAKLIFKGKIISISELPPDKNYDDNALLFLSAKQHPHYRAVEISIDEIYKGKYQGDRIIAYVDTVSKCGLDVKTLENKDFFLIYQERKLSLGNDYEMGNKCGSIIDEKDKLEWQNKG